MVPWSSPQCRPEEGGNAEKQNGTSFKCATSLTEAFLEVPMKPLLYHCLEVSLMALASCKEGRKIESFILSRRYPS